MTARDQEVHDALVRTIACRLPACSEAELRELDRVLVILERAREPWFLRPPLEKVVLLNFPAASADDRIAIVSDPLAPPRGVIVDANKAPAR